jgi:hypothetical protein
MNPNKYHCYIDDDNQEVFFFLFDLVGNITGSQIYRPYSNDKKHNNGGRYTTYCSKFAVRLFGVECLREEGDIYIVEGIFKASKLHSLGYNAIAVLSDNPVYMKNIFYILSKTRNIFAIGDNDKAGKSLVNFIGNSAPKMLKSISLNKTKLGILHNLFKKSLLIIN